jgi:acetyltransferase-like isoleucine patch superfamily enzyme
LALKWTKIESHSFIVPGVTIGEGVAVGASSSVYRDVPFWAVVAGNPATKLKNRALDNTSEGHLIC